MPATTETAKDAMNDLFLTVVKEADIAASPQLVWDALLEQMGPGCERPDGVAVPMTLEAWPGGRWVRDTGDKTGHFWGHVQVIKAPVLLEITGPMFMSYPVASHVRYQIAAREKGSKITITHQIMGRLAPEHRGNLTVGWDHVLKTIKKFAAR